MAKPAQHNPHETDKRPGPAGSNDTSQLNSSVSNRACMAPAWCGPFCLFGPHLNPRGSPMLCTSRRCRILLPDRVPLNELVSSLDFRSTVTAQQLDRLRQKFLKAHRAEECPAELREDALAACTMAASVPLYVAHASGVCAYPIRPEVILHPCDCWGRQSMPTAMAVSSSSPRACVTSRLSFSVMVEISLSERLKLGRRWAWGRWPRRI